MRNRTLARVGRVLLVAMLLGSCKDSTSPGPTRVASLALTADNPTIVVGKTGQLTATAKDAGGNVLSGRQVTYTSSTPAVAVVSAAGVVTGLAPGQSVIVAQSEGQMAGLIVTVILEPVATVTLSGGNSVLVGSTLPLTATLRNSAGAVLSGRRVEWSSSNSSIATVGTEGNVVGVSPGSATITASAGGQSASLPITVLPVPVARVDVQPASASVAAGQTVQYIAVLRDANGNVLFGRDVTWSTGNSTLARVDAAGVVTGIAPGTTAVTASAEGRTGSASVVVTPASVAQVVVSPLTFTVFTGASQQLAVVLRDPLGAVLTGRNVGYASGNPSIATVSSTGNVTGVSPGTTSIFVTSEGRVAAAAVTVVETPVASVVVTAPQSAMLVGETVQLTASARDVGGREIPGRTFVYSSSDPSLATVTSTGLVVGNAPGVAFISVSTGGVIGIIAITINPRPVRSVIITPPNANLFVGGTYQFSTTLRDDLGNVVIRPVTWSSSNTGVARVSSTGLVTAVGVGQANITATAGGVTAASPVIVAQTPATRIEVTPTTRTIQVGEAYRLTAQVFDNNGVQLTDRTVTWFSSNPSVVTVDASGTIRGVAPSGSQNVYVSASVNDLTNGPLTAVALITVVPVPVASVSLQPSAPGPVAIGGTLQLTGVALDANNNPIPSQTVTWTSSAPAVATVSASGLVTGVAAGATTITASAGGKSAQVQLTVQ